MLRVASRALLHRIAGKLLSLAGVRCRSCAFWRAPFAHSKLGRCSLAAANDRGYAEYPQSTAVARCARDYNADLLTTPWHRCSQWRGLEGN